MAYALFRGGDPLADRRPLLIRTMFLDRVLQVKEVVCDLRDDLLALFEGERTVFPELVAGRPSHVDQIRLVAAVVGGERLDESLFGVTDDRRVVSDRLGFIEGGGGVVPRVVDRDVQETGCVVLVLAECDVDVVVCGSVVLAVTLGSVSEYCVGVRPGELLVEVYSETEILIDSRWTD